MQTPQTAAVALSDEPFEYQWLGPGRAVRSVAALDFLAPVFQDPTRITTGLLPVSPLLAAYGAFLARLVDVAELDAVQDRGLEHAALALHQTVLFEALRPVPSPGPELRRRIEEHIEQNLASRFLTPTSIAAALGVSVRAIHLAFEGQAVRSLPRSVVGVFSPLLRCCGTPELHVHRSHTTSDSPPGNN